MDRLDLALRTKYPYSRSQLQKAIREGYVKVNGEVIVDPKIKVQHTDLLIFDSEKFSTMLQAQYEKPIPDISLYILYENKDFLVLNKPAGLVVHHGAGNKSGTLTDALVQYLPTIATVGNGQRVEEYGSEVQSHETCSDEGQSHETRSYEGQSPEPRSDEGRCGIVHRLDKDTTGLILVAKTNETFLQLTSLFKERKIYKVYYALVHGHIKGERQIITRIGRNPRNGKKQAVLQGDIGREAVTFIQEVAYLPDDKTLLKLTPKTGRMHQLRVHMHYLHHPIVGDKIYGPKNDGDNLFLHAYMLGFSLAHTEYKFTAPFPDYWEGIIPDDLLP